MTEAIEQLKSTIDALPLPQRVELARHLIDSLEPKEEGAWEEWLALAQQRMADMESGRVAGIPAEAVLASMGRGKK